MVVVEVREASASLCATEESLPSERDHLARFLGQVGEFNVWVSEYSHSRFRCSVAHEPLLQVIDCILTAAVAVGVSRCRDPVLVRFEEQRVF